jgi:hypothetical protein
MNNELRISILFSVIVEIYNFVVNIPKSGVERTRAWRERKRTSEMPVQNMKRKLASEVTVQNVKKKTV